MKKIKFGLYRLEGCSLGLGIGYHTKSFHVVILFWALSVEFKKW